MTQLIIINLIKTFRDGSYDTYIENFIGKSKVEVYKKVCQYLYGDEEELFTALGIKFPKPVQSIDFITDGEVDNNPHVYKDFLYEMINEIEGMSGTNFNVDLIYLNLTMEDSTLREFDFGKR